MYELRIYLDYTFTAGVGSRVLKFGVADPVGDFHAGAVRDHLAVFLRLCFTGSRP